MPRESVDVPTYEITFLTDQLDEPTIDAIYDALDALVSEHAGSTRLTVSAEGSSAFDAAQLAVANLEQLGVQVRRTSEDLVTRRDIAERLGLTAQAVGLWVRGERHAEDPFPEPFNSVAGGVWLWGDVTTWACRHGLGVEQDVQFPSREDHARINACLADRDNRVTFAWPGVSNVVTHGPVVTTSTNVSSASLTEFAPKTGAVGFMVGAADLALAV